MGSIPPAEAFEHPMRELVAVIDYSQLVPDDGDLEQVAKGVRSQRMNYCEDTGSVNTLSVALDPPLDEYTIGLPIHVKIRSSNSGPATIDAGAGRVPIRKPNGAELAANDLPAGGVAGLIYDGTVFQLMGGAAAATGGSQVFQINIPYCVDTSPTANTVIANFTPAIATYAAGLIFMVKIANTNNTFSNINVNGLGLKPIYAQGSHPNWPLLPGDMQAGDVLVFTYDGSAFWVYANTTVNENVTFNVSNLTQFNQIFTALGRKRISASGSIRILMAAGNYVLSAGTTITTYHADADRMTIEGTMQAGQTAPITGNFQRTGNTPAYRSGDASANYAMLKGRYATDIQMAAGANVGIQHVGPGAITYKNLLVTAPGTYALGARAFSAGGSAVLRCIDCCVWGAADVGFCTTDGYIFCTNCHVSYSQSRGFAAAGRAGMTITGGGAHGCATHGVEAAHGAAIGTVADGAGNYCQSSFNGGHGFNAQSGMILLRNTYASANAGVGLYAQNMGIGGLVNAPVDSSSPAPGTVGNLNSIVILYA